MKKIFLSAFLHRIFIVMILIVLLFFRGSGQGLQAEAMDMNHIPHFTPVRSAERALAAQINIQRQLAGTRPLQADWDLFRFARYDAEDLVSGKIKNINEKKMGQLLHDMSRPVKSVGYYVIRADKGQSFPLNWWSTSEGEILLQNAAPTVFGIGQAACGRQQVWVILFSRLTTDRN